MYRRLFTLVAVFLALSPAWAQDAGSVARVHPAGFITHGPATKQAQVSDPLAWADIVRTDADGRMAIALTDGSALTLGAKSEMRIVKHDPASQQSTMELLYGRMRARVTAVTQKGGGFQVHTPTAVIGVIGSGFAVQVNTESATTGQVVTRESIEQLPVSGRPISDLAQLAPGAVPGAYTGPTLADYTGANETIVYGLEHTTWVRNIDPKVMGMVFLLPGEYTIVRRGQAPTPPAMAKPQDLFDEPAQPYGPPGPCVSVIDLSQPGGSQAPHSLTITGMGTSTGDVFQVILKNTGACQLIAFVPAGAVLKPTGFTERVIKGILISGNPSLKDFQIMISVGTEQEVEPGGEITFTLRAYCLQLHKLAPHQKTKYEFEDPQKQAEMADDRALIDVTTRLYHTGQIQSSMHGLPTIIQWVLWAFREKMDAKSFHEEFFKLVRKNMEARKEKWNKDTERNVEAMEQDLWTNVQKVRQATT
jgi:hypothetical protein